MTCMQKQRRNLGHIYWVYKGQGVVVGVGGLLRLLENNVYKMENVVKKNIDTYSIHIFVFCPTNLF